MGLSSCCGFGTIRTGVFIIGICYVLLVIPLCIRVALDPLSIWYMYLLPLVCLTCGILLILGAKQRKLEFLIPPLCIYFTSIVVLIPAEFVHQFQRVVYTNESSPILYPFLICIILAFSIYFFVVINTFYKSLLCEKYAVLSKHPQVVVQSPDQRQ